MQSRRPHTNAFCDFSSPCVYSIAPATKKWGQAIRSAAPVTQKHLSTPEDLILQNATCWGNQRSDLLTSLLTMSPVLGLPRNMHLCRSSSNVPRLPTLLKLLQNPHGLLTFSRVQNPLRLPHKTTLQRPKWREHMVLLAFHFQMHFAPQRRAIFQHLNFQKCYEHGVPCTCSLQNVLRATTPCTFSTSQLQKVLRTCQFLTLLTSKCASRHNSVHVFIISTSKCVPSMVCFVHVHFKMCFAPQRRALFHHLNFQECSEHVLLCAFWLGHVLRATTACTFSSSQLPKVLRTCVALCILTWTCASRHNGVQFFISHLPNWLRTRRFSEPTFRPSAATNHWRNTVFRDFPTFLRTWIFFLLTLSLLWFSFFFSSLLWFFPPLLFICPYCRKFDF